MDLTLSQYGISCLQHDYLQALTAGSGRAADKVVEAALGLEVAPQRIYLDIFQPTAYGIGRLWQSNQISVAGEHLATAILERQMGELHPLFKAGRNRGRTMVLGCVPDEWHRVGSRMVADFFEADGWEVHYLGANVPIRDMVGIARESNADLIGVSSAMLFNLTRVAQLVQALDEAGLSGIPVIAGGMPFIEQPGLAMALNLRGSAIDAREALELANEVLDTDQGHGEHAPDSVAAAALQAASGPIIAAATLACAARGDDEGDLIAAGFAYTLRMVEAALVAGAPALLDGQIRWANERQPHDGVAPAQLLARLTVLSETVRDHLPPRAAAVVQPYLAHLVSRQRRTMEVA